MLSRKFWISAALLGVCVVFGGGGYPAPMAELVTQLAALACLCAWLFLVPPGAGPAPLDRWLLAGVGLVIAVPLVQLIPLPPAIWHSLPGRALEVEALALVGQADSWRPITVQPYRTLSSALSLLAPLTLLFFVSRLSLSDRTRLLAVLAATAGLASLVSAVQLSSGNANWLRFYSGPSQLGFGVGFFANRNAAAEFFNIAILSLGAFVAIRRDLLQGTMRKAAAAAALLLLLASLLLTGSRTGMGLGVLALIFVGSLFFDRVHLNRKFGLAAGGTLALALVLAFALQDNLVVQKSFKRFDDFKDARPHIWEDTVYAIGQYWPVGSGMGTFVPVVEAAEQLEVVDATRPNRAHNDYLEFTLEAGIFGIAIFAALLIALAVRVTMVLRGGGSRLQRRHVIFALGALTLLAIHSLVDYPLRSITLASLCAMAIGMTARGRSGEAVENLEQSGRRRSAQPA
ncbi:MAG: O-antigen ligase family protein [Sphingomonas sp.]